MIDLDAFFIQCSVTQCPPEYPFEASASGLATIIVFADNLDIARARAGKVIADNKLATIKLKRILRINRANLYMLNSTLLSLYRTAELYGIGFHCDFWSIKPSCCRGDTAIHSIKYSSQ